MKKGHLSSEAAQRQLRDLERTRERQAAADLAELMGLPAFRRFIFRTVVDRCGTFAESFNPNGSVMNRNEGRRSIGIELMAEAQQVAADEWVLGLNERLQQTKCDEQTRQSAQTLKDEDE